MKKEYIYISIVIVVIVILGVLLYPKSLSSDSTIRIGWQIPWATQGQLTQILKNTDILENNGLNGDFKGFSYGGPLNEAALAGEVDVIFTADQPAATLISKDDDWVIIGRLMYNRVSLYIPPNSLIEEISDLRGKTVAMPFGAAAQRMALKVQKDVGLDPNKDVNNINLGIYEQSDLVRDPNAIKWGDIDAMAGFDPTPAIFEQKGLVRNLYVGKIVSVVVMKKSYIERNPDDPQKFMEAFKEAYIYYKNNEEQANNWFIEESKLDIVPEALDIASSIEPNLQVESDSEVRINFIEEDYEIMQEAADFLYNNDMISVKLNMRDHIDTSYI